MVGTPKHGRKKKILTLSTTAIQSRSITVSKRQVQSQQHKHNVDGHKNHDKHTSNTKNKE